MKGSLKLMSVHRSSESRCVEYCAAIVCKVRQYTRNGGNDKTVLFSFTSAPFESRSLTTESLSGTLAEIIRGVQPLPSYAFSLARRNQAYLGNVLVYPGRSSTGSPA